MFFIFLFLFSFFFFLHLLVHALWGKKSCYHFSRALGKSRTKCMLSIHCPFNHFKHFFFFKFCYVKFLEVESFCLSADLTWILDFSSLALWFCFACASSVGALSMGFLCDLGWVFLHLYKFLIFSCRVLQDVFLC